MPTGSTGAPGSRTPGVRATGHRHSSRGGPRPSPRPGARPGATRPRAGGPAVPTVRRPRLTGRAAVLMLVLGVLVVSYASSMRAYLEQRSQMATLRAQIASSQTAISSLSREEKRFRDPAYIRSLAHERLGWVLPGEISFQVLGANGKPLAGQDDLGGNGSTPRPLRTQWWQSAWQSVEAAGHPPTRHDSPATRIEAPRPHRP